jgi:hypothetical protein
LTQEATQPGSTENEITAGNITEIEEDQKIAIDNGGVQLKYGY